MVYRLHKRLFGDGLKYTKIIFVKTLFVVLLIFSAATVSFADQFQVNDLKTAQQAVSIIKRKPYLVSFCSQCDKQSVQVWKIKDVFITTEDGKDFRIKIVGRRVYESRKQFDREKYREPIQYAVSTAPSPDDLWFTEEIDLAYVYIPLGTRNFENLAKFIGLKPDILVDAINLPMDISS